MSIVVGTALTLGSIFRTFMALESLQLVFVWGAAAIFSILITAYGISMVSSATSDPPSPDPEDARRI